MEEQKSPQQETPQWLKHLQENSWEAEILISGGAIFTLFQLANGLLEAAEYFKEVSPFEGLNLLLLFGMILLRGVTIGFIFHLLLRGTWIALVCLNGVYPRGVNFTKLKITGRYLDQSMKTNLTQQIIRLDELSGLVFFGSFLFIIILIGVALAFAVISFLLDTIFSSVPLANRVFQIFLLLAGVYVVDFVTSGILRRNKFVGKLFFPLFSFFNVLSLGVLYRPSLQVISTNINRLKAGVFLLLLFASSIFFAMISIQHALNWGNIFDQRAYWGRGREYASDDLYLDRIPDETRVWRACIQSDFVKDDYLRLFIPYKSRYNVNIEENNKKDFSEIVSVSLNDSSYMHIDWSRYGRERSGQKGIICYLPITHLPKGKNQLSIQIKGQIFYHSEEPKLLIPFWKE